MQFCRALPENLVNQQLSSVSYLPTRSGRDQFEEGERRFLVKFIAIENVGRIEPTVVTKT